MRRALAVLVVALVGCAIRSEDGEPVQVPLVLQFPSKTSATVLDNVAIYAFDGIGCVDVLEQYNAGGVSVDPVAQVSADLCSFYFRDVTFEVPIGSHTFLAVGTGPNAQQEIVEYYRGCVEQSIGSSPAELPITMSFSNDVPAEPNSCASVAIFCNRQCPN